MVFELDNLLEGKWQAEASIKDPEGNTIGSNTSSLVITRNVTMELSLTVYFGFGSIRGDIQLVDESGVPERDAEGELLKGNGIFVHLKDTDNGAVADVSGFFIDDVPAGPYNLRIFDHGNPAIEREVTVIADQPVDLGTIDYCLSEKSDYDGVNVLFVNNGRDKFSDASLREAISLALDREKMQKCLDTVWWPDREPFVVHGISAPDQLGYPDHIIETNLERARQIVSDLGFTGVHVVVSTNGDAYVRRVLVEYVVEQLCQIGLQAEAELLTFDGLVERFNDGAYDLMIAGFTPPTRMHSANLIFNLFHTEGTFNTAGFSNPVCDSLVENLFSIYDTVQFDLEIKRIEEMVATFYKVIPMFRLKITNDRGIQASAITFELDAIRE